jgi:hypothetical protein
MYILVVTVEGIRRLDWWRLKGYFNRIPVYDVDGDRFTDGRDLRRMGWLRDVALDVLALVYMGRRFQRSMCMINRDKILIRWRVRRLLQRPCVSWGSLPRGGSVSEMTAPIVGLSESMWNPV